MPAPEDTIELRPAACRSIGMAADVEHSVQIREVRKAFGSFEVLTGLNLNFVDNAITTVLGPSGSAPRCCSRT
jgi:phospholipid/cholesterol/gamma-HCH transport system ATP-binding protein